MIKCGKFLTIKKEGSANQSGGCDARRKAQYGPPAALCSAALFNYAEMCQRPQRAVGAALFSFCRVLFIEKLGVLMTDKGGFL